jgi:hypothetical protein
MSSAMNGLFARAVVAFLVLPGVVAFLVPLLFWGPGTATFSNSWGIVPLSVGIAVLLSCVREFYVAGRGTLAPWAPRRGPDSFGLGNRLPVMASGSLRHRGAGGVSPACRGPRGTFGGPNLREYLASVPETCPAMAVGKVFKKRGVASWRHAGEIPASPTSLPQLARR